MPDENLFTLIKNSADTGTSAAKIMSLLSTTGVDIMTYPPGLGGFVNNADTGKPIGLPYVLFAPYKRPAGLKGLSSISPASVLDNLPSPNFAIALPLPASALKTTYGVEYEAVSLGEIGAIASGLNNVWDTIKGAWNNTNQKPTKELVQDVLLKGGLALGEVAGSSLARASLNVAGALSDGGGAALSKISGLSANPYTETLFKNVEFRSHSFEYVFSPKTHEESVLVDKIIQIFKFYMLPSNTTWLTSGEAGALFSFPYEFQITYSVSDTTFTLLPSVLESMKVDYSPSTEIPRFFVTDKTGKQYPARITVSLDFKEIMLLTRDQIAVPDGELRGTAEQYDIQNAALAGFKRYRF